jgi:hypothetical protein
MSVVPERFLATKNTGSPRIPVWSAPLDVVERVMVGVARGVE